MGIDLDFYIMSGSDKEIDLWLGYDRLRFDRSYSLFKRLDINDDVFSDKENINMPDIKLHKLPKERDFRIYRDEGLTKTNEDPYGNQLYYMYAKEIYKLDDNLIENTTKKNKGIIKMVKELDDNDVIILYWH